MRAMSEMQAIEGVPELTLGWRLKMALNHGGVSVQEMADLLEYSRARLSDWLNDKSKKPPRKLLLQKWALRCGVNPDWLINGVMPSGNSGPDGPGEQVMTSTEWYVSSRRVADIHPLRHAA